VLNAARPPEARSSAWCATISTIQPIIYTPTVGRLPKYGLIFPAAQHVHFASDADHIAEV
jgi:hypothetical protein